MCTSELKSMEVLTRTDMVFYLFNCYMYFVIVAAPAVGFVFGVYLWASVNVFETHYNESFSSLTVSSYKNWLRLRIRSDGAYGR